MTIERSPGASGVNVHLEAGECELLVKLACDAERAHDGGATPEIASSYFSLSVALGQRIRALALHEPTLLREDGTTINL